MRRLPVVVVLLLVASACYSDTSNLTESGRGRPLISVEFPRQVQRGSVHTATVEVSNPGPGDIGTLLLSFSPLGSPTEGMEDPLVRVGRGARSPSILAVEPRPQGAGQGGVLYRFGPLDEGDSRTLRFRLKAPPRPGTVANSVLVYDGGDTSRARGVRLATRVLP